MDTTILSQGIVVHYQVESLKVARINEWILNGPESLPMGVLFPALPKRGTVFTAENLRRAVTNLISIYQNAGFPFTSVQPVGLQESAYWVSPSLTIKEGKRVRIDFVKFVGINPSSENLLLRYIGFKKGGIYSPALKRVWQRNLEKSGWIQVDSAALVSGTNGTYGIQFYLCEKRSGEAYAGAGYLPEQRRFLGWAGIKLLNLLHSGRTLHGEWRSVPGRTHYNLSYTEPWVFSSPLSLTAFAQHQTIDTSFAFTTLSLTSNAQLGIIEIQLGGGIERLVGLVKVQTTWLGTGVTFDHRRQRDEGVLFRIGTRGGSRQSNKESASILARVEGDFALGLPIGRKLTWGNSLRLRLVLSPKELTPPEMYCFGGAQSVRGFREESFISTGLGWWNCELRYHLPNQSRLQIFLDTGVYDDTARTVPHPVAAYGAGGRWQTRLGTLGIDYGIPVYPVYETPWRGKVHLSFTTGF